MKTPKGMLGVTLHVAWNGEEMPPRLYTVIAKPDDFQAALLPIVSDRVRSFSVTVDGVDFTLRPTPSLLGWRLLEMEDSGVTSWFTSEFEEAAVEFVRRVHQALV